MTNQRKPVFGPAPTPTLFLLHWQRRLHTFNPSTSYRSLPFSSPVRLLNSTLDLCHAFVLIHNFIKQLQRYNFTLQQLLHQLPEPLHQVSRLALEDIAGIREDLQQQCEYLWALKNGKFLRPGIEKKRWWGDLPLKVRKAADVLLEKWSFAVESGKWEFVTCEELEGMVGKDKEKVDSGTEE